MWGTDMTEVKTLEGRAYVFVAVDHCSSELVGHHASLSATSREALRPQRSGGGFAFGVLLAVTGWTLATGVYLWSDGIAGLALPLADAMEWYVGAGDWLLAWLRAATRFAQDLATG